MTRLQTRPLATSAGHTPGVVGYACAEHLSRRAEYERTGSVIYASPCGTCTTPVFAGPLAEAAPEMYEALLLVLAGYTKLGPFDEPLGSSEQTVAINAARAAIAKATGAA